MRELNLTADELVSKLLAMSERETVCLLDSCGVRHLGSHLLIAGILPVDLLQISNDNAEDALSILESSISRDLAAVFTVSYDFGSKLQLGTSLNASRDAAEPDIFLALFATLIIHDYDNGRTFIVGDESVFTKIEEAFNECRDSDSAHKAFPKTQAASNFRRREYISAIEQIQEYIRRGDTYQTNLTQQIKCPLPAGMTSQAVFRRLRLDHPAPFAAFITRPDSAVVSASPERFFRIGRDGAITTSPVKGTLPRGGTPEDDARLRAELESSEKDRAENIMIVDLMRNDLGRVCEFGSVTVEKLCDVEEHPTLFHLVSTVRGKLRDDASFPDVMKALFPCGSITGAPKIRTMQIIDEIESERRGLSMGAIGSYIPRTWNVEDAAIDSVFDLSVAIRTMVIRRSEAVFSVGGGIVIDSDPEKEFDESLLKAKALLHALGAEM